MNILSKIKNLFVQNKDSQKSQVLGFTSERFIGRVHGFTWAIIETRDPNYDGEKLKKESVGMLMIMACNFATPIEMKLFTQIMEKSKTVPESNSAEIDYTYGALEGKLVIYNKKDPQLLLKNCKIDKE